MTGSLPFCSRPGLSEARDRDFISVLPQQVLNRALKKSAEKPTEINFSSPGSTNWQAVEQRHERGNDEAKIGKNPNLQGVHQHIEPAFNEVFAGAELVLTGPSWRGANPRARSDPRLTRVPGPLHGHPVRRVGDADPFAQTAYTTSRVPRPPWTGLYSLPGDRPCRRNDRSCRYRLC